ncbi:uncharacterized protein LOC114534568 isoform X2 [Dendronephthya gigantea]|uniref:uncharacterized protein LOC114534568 isoform X2 n=1 Tax=Dendronephthya gigantea TaxID=151771 RepID=UPI00106D3607|nr:uncharacterized protein LOC114534568 isoform X2 [Dendronephthya gigantea]
MMLQWLILLTLFLHIGWAYNLYDEIDECIKDILVLWDNSPSVNVTNFNNRVRPFLKTLIADEKLNVGRDGTHIGFITFASAEKTRVLLRVGQKTDKEDLQTWLDNLNYKKDLTGRNTFTGNAFKLASDEFSERSPLNHRDDVSDVILLFTDGEPMALWETENQTRMAGRYSAELRARKVFIVSLAVGAAAKKDKAWKLIDSWSDIMYKSGFDQLDEVVKNIVTESCSIKPVECACKYNISTEQFTKPGENTILIPWKKPELGCDRHVDVEKVVSPPGARSPQHFGVGRHEIMYTFTYLNKKKSVSTSCPVIIKVGACECPSTQTVQARVNVGHTKVSVSWSEPVPTCPTEADADNPQPSGEFSVGEHKVTYQYTHETELQSFKMQCHVNIVVKGEYCGEKVYDPDTNICCCGTPYARKSGYKCCGNKYYNPCSTICCQDTSLVSVGGHCP